MDPHFSYGERVRITGTFLTSTGSASVDPNVVRGAYYAEAVGAATVYTYGTNAELVKGGPGVYYFDVDTNESSGRYFWAIFSTSAGSQAAEDGVFYVKPRRFTVP